MGRLLEEAFATTRGLVGIDGQKAIQGISLQAAKEAGVSEVAWVNWANDRLRSGETYQSLVVSFGPRAPVTPADRGRAWIADLQRRLSGEPDEEGNPPVLDDLAEAIRDDGEACEEVALYLIDQLRALQRQAEETEAERDELDGAVAEHLDLREGETTVEAIKRAGAALDALDPMPTKQELGLLSLLRSSVVQSLEFGQYTIRRKGRR